MVLMINLIRAFCFISTCLEFVFTLKLLYFLLPMTNDSTPISIRSDIEDIATPRKSSVLFLRQFARVYMALGTADLSRIIIN